MKMYISIILISISSLAIAQEENNEKLVSKKLKSLVARQKALGTDTIITYQLKSNGSFGVVIPENADKKTIDSLSCDYKTPTFVLSLLNGNITINKLNPCLNFKPLN
ncbi:hypothetical protein EZ428_07255 [Pedobacter frigiditerrae]|uniref:Spi protease inhibitor domain-containing protein n=1 Tax=Pedobacter frigiditerrae TaxID=2530452 RepID=A0A4R0MZW7_9SPHI|nr:hypothetical protein [Pedobacter frigiditerrae]TCC91554.1 hypothetical protein EZ428_07255 [Pedobacter frigiditerrae]